MALVTQHVSSEIQARASAAYSEFVAAHGLEGWNITIIGLQAPAVAVTVETPNGDLFGPHQFALTLTFQEDLRAFLEFRYREQTLE